MDSAIRDMKMNPIEEYYGKFNEDKRLKSRHGLVEYRLSMKYIEEALERIKEKTHLAKEEISILDLGAGTGAYSIPLAEKGYKVTAVELVKHNLSRLKVRSKLVDAHLGNAMDLHKYPEASYDLVLIFGPMYHLFSHEDKLKVMNEVKRVAKEGAVVMVAYCMNEYSVVMYALKEKHLKECVEGGRLDETFHTRSDVEDLYDYVRMEDVDRLVEESGFKRIKTVTPDGPTNYIRPVLKAMTEEEFDIYISYVEAIAERQDLIGAAAHIIDILEK